MRLRFPRSRLTFLITGVGLIILSFLLETNVVPAFREAVGKSLVSVLPATKQGAVTLLGILTISLGMGLLIASSVDLANYLVARSRKREAPIVNDVTLLGKSYTRTFTVPKFVIENVVFKPIVRAMSNSLSERMVAAGVIRSPVIYVSRFVFYAFISAIVTIPLSIILLLVLNEPKLLLINVAPLIFVLAPRFTVGSKLGERTKGVEDELPYFAMFAAVMQSAGLTLYHAFEKIIGSGVFRWVEGEALLITRENLFFGKTQLEALDERARQHDSERFKTFLQGYTSVLKSGGEVARYLDDKAKQFLNWTEFRWKMYANSSSDIGELIISTFFAMPLIIIAMAFVYPEGTLDVLELTVAFVIPILTILAFMGIVRAQPKINNIIQGRLKPSIAATVATLVALILLQQPMWIIFAGGLGVFSAVFGLSTLFQVREIRKSDEALPQFLRDITEFRKIGYDITKAVQRLASERTYNGIFDTILKDVSRQLEIGSTMTEVFVKTRSWLSRIVFFILGEIVETGGGSPELLESLTDFTQRIVTVKKETKSQMKIYEILGYATPIGLALTISIMQSMMSQFSGVVTGGESLGILSTFSSLPPLFLDISKILIIEAGVAVSFLAGKAIDFTSQNTVRITSIIAVGTFAILAADMVLPLLSLR